MQFVNKDNVYLKICFEVFRDVISRVLEGVSTLINPPRSASPQPDLLEFTAGFDVSIVFKHEIEFILGQSNRQS